MSAPEKIRKNRFKRLFQALGPGVTTGAADDDPSGVATYSIVGAQYGTTFLWSAFVTWPLMGCVQIDVVPEFRHRSKVEVGSLYGVL